MHTRKPRAAARVRLLLASLSCSLLAFGCASIGYDGLPPDVYVIDIVPLESTAFEQRMRVDLRIRNPNEFAFEVDGVRFDLDLNGARFARGLGSQTATVPRLGEARVSVIATTTVMSWVRQVAALSQPGRKDIDYRVSGRLFLSNELLAYVSFESSGNLGDPTGQPQR